MYNNTKGYHYIYRKRKYIYTQVNSMIAVAVTVTIVLCEDQIEVIENVKTLWRSNRSYWER